jgi:hypothetical protein
MPHFSMRHALFLPTFVLPVLFSLTLFLLRLQPPDDAVRAFLDDLGACLAGSPFANEAGCTLGLRVGVTDLNAVDGFARRHPWVETARFSRGMEVDSGYLLWSWTGAQPPYLVESGGLWVERGLVHSVTLPTTLRLGDVWMLLPTPDATDWFVTMANAPANYYNLIYFGSALEVQAVLAHPVSPARFWHSAVKLYLSPLRPSPDGQPGAHLPWERPS